MIYSLLRITVYVLLCGYATCQWSSWSGQNPITGDKTFWMDSSSQCSQKVFEIGTSSVTVYGRAAVQINPGSLTECVLTLSSDSVGQRRRFQVEIIVATVNEPGVQFTMYDGQSTSSNRIFVISKGAPIDTSKKYDTSGGFVTFYLTKNSPADVDFSIQLRVLVVPDISGPSDECKTGNEFGCNYYGYHTPIEKDVVIGIVGGIFGLILFIVIPIIVICCYRKSKGVNKKWDEFNLHDTPNTAADIHNSTASLTKSKKDLWTSQSSRAPYSDVKKSYARSRQSDNGSDFSDVSDLPPKHRPPPPPYDEFDRGPRSYRDGGRGYRNGREDRFDRRERYDDRYNDRVDRDYKAERNSRPRYDSDKKSYHSSSDDASFVQGRDDHPQEVFVERVIEPRVKPPSKADLQKRAKYDYDDEDPYDKIVDESPRVKPKKEVKESAMQCEEESSEDNESNTESDDEPPSTDETDDDDIIKKKEAEAKKAALYAKPKKKARKKTLPEKTSAPAVTAEVTYPGPVPPGGVQMVPGQPVFYNAPRPNGPQMFPRPIHPGQPPYFNQPPHPRPIMSMSALPPPQPGMVQGYTQPPISGRLPPPTQSQRFPPPPPTMYSAQQPLQPPVFTHLVQRGYDRQSPSLDGSEGRNRSDDSDMVLNLDSGVEFMKRTTTTV